jgi:hypothetical protein
MKSSASPSLQKPPDEGLYPCGYGRLAAGGDRVAQLIAAIEAVYGMTNAVAGGEVRHGGTPDIVAGKM